MRGTGIGEQGSGIGDRGSGGAAAYLLAGHILLIAFATLAMVTILAGPFPVWMQGPYTARVYQVSWQYTGQVYVVLGAFAAFAHAAPRFGPGRSLALFAAATALALSSELIGTNFGVPFGPYRYTAMLGYRVHGDVPYAIPLSWSYMLYASLALCARTMREAPSPAARWRWAVAAGAMMVAWDVPLEVQMTNVQPAHWAWHLADAPSWVPPFLARGVYYGMPLTNWMGWLLTATLIARAMLEIVPPAVWRERAAPAMALPLALYAANSIMPIATTARHGLWGAAVAGTLAMGVPLALARRAATS